MQEERDRETDAPVFMHKHESQSFDTPSPSLSPCSLLNCALIKVATWRGDFERIREEVSVFCSQQISPIFNHQQDKNNIQLSCIQVYISCIQLYGYTRIFVSVCVDVMFVFNSVNT